MVFALSAWVTCVSFFSLRMRRAGLVPSRWRLPECMRTILPFAVILKRLRAPRCVLSFFLGFSELRGIALNPLRTFQTSGAKAPLYFVVATARLKSCPPKNTVRAALEILRAEGLMRLFAPGR